MSALPPIWTLGAARSAGSSGAVGHFAGAIDEVRISDVARYMDDFTPVLRFQPDAHTLALYHCDEGEGDRLVDSSSHQYHGQLVGASWLPLETPSVKASDPLLWEKNWSDDAAKNAGGATDDQ